MRSKWFERSKSVARRERKNFDIEKNIYQKFLFFPIKHLSVALIRPHPGGDSSCEWQRSIAVELGENRKSISQNTIFRKFCIFFVSQNKNSSELILAREAKQRKALIA